ncbi:MAG: hypothetical protein KZQ83_18315 [gamma proteobacterium symbiont of Taylorina sp.]|nr:hypothetical protein [gamma proteobacterium symbiont of Taylorina sp.]
MKLPQPKIFTIELLAKYWTTQSGEEVTPEQVISYGRDGTLKFRWYFNHNATLISEENLPDETEFVFLNCSDLWEIIVFDETGNAIFQQQGDEEFQAGLKASKEIDEHWAARGFSLPQGVQVAQQAELQQKLQSQMASRSRDLAIKCAQQDITLESLKSSSFRINQDNYPELSFYEGFSSKIPCNSIRITVSDNEILQSNESVETEAECSKNNLTDKIKDNYLKTIHALTIALAETKSSTYKTDTGKINCSQIENTLQTKGLTVSEPRKIISQALKTDLS